MVIRGYMHPVAEVTKPRRQSSTQSARPKQEAVRPYSRSLLSPTQGWSTEERVLQVRQGEAGSWHMPCRAWAKLRVNENTVSVSLASTGRKWWAKAKNPHLVALTTGESWTPNLGKRKVRRQLNSLLSIHQPDEERACLLLRRLLPQDSAQRLPLAPFDRPRHSK